MSSISAEESPNLHIVVFGTMSPIIDDNTHGLCNLVKTALERELGDNGIKVYHTSLRSMAMLDLGYQMAAEKNPDAPEYTLLDECETLVSSHIPTMINYADCLQTTLSQLSGSTEVYNNIVMANLAQIAPGGRAIWLVDSMHYLDLYDAFLKEYGPTAASLRYVLINTVNTVGSPRNNIGGHRYGLREVNNIYEERLLPGKVEALTLTECTVKLNDLTQSLYTNAVGLASTILKTLV